MTTFSSLGVSNSLLKALPELGIETPTEIQQKAIPLLTGNKKDFIGLAQTGTGKTAAFGLPLLDAIDTDKKHTQALVIVPTRELGQQVAQQLAAFSKYKNKIHLLAVYGGASIGSQIRALKKGVQIVIATPGRLIDLVDRKAVHLDRIEYLVLDEADEMLNMGFKEDIDYVLSHTTGDHATWLFSATMPREIRKIIKSYMDKDADEVHIDANVEVNENIDHQYTVVKASDKTEALKRFIDSNPYMKSIIFCRTKASTQSLAEELLKQGYRVDALHGDLNQGQRDKVMRRFKAHSLNMITATDVAARGIHVNDLTHIIHYNLPDDPDYYTHRSGRTARAGKKGIALALLSGKDISKLGMLERKLKIKFKKVPVPDGADIGLQIAEAWATKLVAMPVAENLDPKIKEQALSALEGISKEDIIERLISKELGNRNYDSQQRDLNTKPEKPAVNGKVKETKPDMVRFFINIGSVDKVKQKDLSGFLCDRIGIQKSDLGDIDLKKNCSFFEVHQKHTRKVANSFRGLIIEGRKIRVNRDEQGSSGDKPKSGKKRHGRKKFSKKKSR